MKLDLADPFAPRVVLRSELLRAPGGGGLAASGERAPARARAAARPTSRSCTSSPCVLQNPGKQFDWQHPPLPGQEFPGLSLSAEVIQLFLLMAKRVGAEGMALRPSSFHAARAYARHFSFLDGAAQVRFEALRDEPRAPTAVAALLGAGPGVRPVRWRTGDVDAGSDGRAPRHTGGAGGGFHGAPGGAAKRPRQKVPHRPGLPPPQVPLGADASTPGPGERPGATSPTSPGALSGRVASAPCLYWPNAASRGLARGSPPARR